jgi:hypothetical protein
MGIVPGQTGATVAGKGGSGGFYRDPMQFGTKKDAGAG